MQRGLRSFTSCAGLLAFVSLLASGCKQSSGDRCEIDSDCADGLHCDIGTSASLHDGVCTNMMGVATPPDAAAPDASVTPDLAPPDTLFADGAADSAVDSAGPDAAVDTGTDAADASITPPDTAVDVTPDRKPDVTPDTAAGS
jgi:hypothetical protein